MLVLLKVLLWVMLIVKVLALLNVRLLTVYTRFTNTISHKHPRAIIHSKQE
jgi:hypothetical protein